jgi:RimJ/RimL family protein N-acetyltransferase
MPGELLAQSFKPMQFHKKLVAFCLSATGDSMTYHRKLSGEKCYLSPLSPADAGSFTIWMNDLEITLPLGDEAYLPYSEARMQSEIEDAIRRQDHVFSIVECATDRLIGRCLLFGINPVDRNAMLGIFIGEKDCWNKGFGTEACRLLLDYAFNLLNLHSVMLGVFAFNQRAVRSYEKVGFRQIGRRREARIIAGKAHDAILMDILEDEFRQQWPSVLQGLI